VGNKFYLHTEFNKHQMIFRGDYECTMDDKGRIKMPAALRKLFAAENETRFVLVKDLQDCLAIYPMKNWLEVEARLDKLNPFSTSHQRFIDLATDGWTEVEIDSADRFLVNTSLRKVIGSGKDILLKGKQKKIQIWDEKKYSKTNETNRNEAEQLSADVAKYLDELEGGGK